MANIWNTLFNSGIDDSDIRTNGPVDNYAVDKQQIRNMGLRYAGRDQYGNRVWKDKMGHEYNAIDLQKQGADNKSDNNSGSGNDDSTNWQQYANNNAPKPYMPPVINFPIPDTALNVPGLTSWKTVTNQQTAINKFGASQWIPSSEMPNVMKTVNNDDNGGANVGIRIIFLSSRSGKLLEDRNDIVEPEMDTITFKKEKISVRAIDDNDWKILKEDNAPANGTVNDVYNGEIGYIKNSVQVHADFDKLYSDITNIINPVQSDGRKGIERNLVIFFDTEHNVLISKIQDPVKNTATQSYDQISQDQYEQTFFWVDKYDRSNITIGTMHTHPYQSQPLDDPGTHKPMSKKTVNAKGMSPDDFVDASLHLIVNYAIEVYVNPIFVSKAYPDNTQDIRFKSLNDILNGNFNLFLDTIEIYIKWHH